MKMNIVSGGVIMFYYVWPIVLVVLSNTMYQICTKSVPSDMNPFASLSVTYLVGGIGKSGLIFRTWICRESYQRIRKTELGSVCSRYCDCRSGGRLDLCV